MIPTTPADRPVYEGEIATYWIDDDGILVSVSKPPRRTVDNIKRNMDLVLSITQNRKLPLLIYLCDSPVPNRETREFVNRALPNLYSAMAMISRPGLAAFIMKFLFRLRTAPIPMKSFTDDQPAREWLKQYL